MGTREIIYAIGILGMLAGCSDSSSSGASGAGADADIADRLDFFPDLGLSDAADPVVDAGVDGGAEPEDIGFFDAGPMDADTTDGGFPSASVNLAFVGPCQPDFSGTMTVTGGTGLTVSSLQGGQLQASLQVDLGSATGAQIISTRGRLETGLAINLVTGSTWTNASTDPEVIAGNAPDPVEGTLLITAYSPMFGVADLTFIGVVLANTDDGSLCTINGTLTTERLGQ